MLDRVVQVRALAKDIVLCSWAGHITLTVPLSTQVYKLCYLHVGKVVRFQPGSLKLAG